MTWWHDKLNSSITWKRYLKLELNLFTIFKNKLNKDIHESNRHWRHMKTHIFTEIIIIIWTLVAKRRSTVNSKCTLIIIFILLSFCILIKNFQLHYNISIIAKVHNMFKSETQFYSSDVFFFRKKYLTNRNSVCIWKLI